MCVFYTYSIRDDPSAGYKDENKEVDFGTLSGNGINGSPLGFITIFQ